MLFESGNNKDQSKVPLQSECKVEIFIKFLSLFLKTGPISESDK